MCDLSLWSSTTYHSLCLSKAAQIRYNLTILLAHSSSSGEYMSSNNPYGADPLQPQIPRPSGSNTGLIIGIVAAVVAIPMLLACAGILVALLIPAVQAGREAARRVKCSNNLRQISLALLNYHDAYGSFPPAYTVDAGGTPLHSWRTLILPFMEQQALYDQIDLSKPWDDLANSALNDIFIEGYACPSTVLSPGMTTYVAVVDPSGIFSGSNPCTMRQITDGTSNTLLVIETDVTNAVSWMQPQDIDLKTFSNPGRGSHVGGGNFAMADGSVHFLSDNADPLTRSALVTIAGQEAVQLP